MDINILILGAFDRYNYGDLLFPHIIELALKQRGIIGNFHFYAIRNSNLSKYGGKKSKGIRRFYKDAKTLKNVIVIIAGGESIGISWLKMFSFYSFIYKIIAKFQKFFNVDFFVRKYLGAATDLPFIFTKNVITAQAIILNSLGECGAKQEDVNSNYTFKCLSEVDYFAVRDRYTLNAFSSFPNIKLYPDSAILMSEFYDKEYLQKHISSKVNDFISNNCRDYIFFQINNSFLGAKTNDFANMFDQIYAVSKKVLCFCAIGRASGHEDHIALKKVIKQIKSPVYLFDKASIGETMSLIANSELYVGSSLHGVITSMSYLVPYIGLGGKQSKVEAYIKTWGGRNNVCIDIETCFDELFPTIMTVLNNDKKYHEDVFYRDKQIIESNISFDNIVRIINQAILA